MSADLSMYADLSISADSSMSSEMVLLLSSSRESLLFRKSSVEEFVNISLIVDCRDSMEEFFVEPFLVPAARMGDGGLSGLVGRESFFGDRKALLKTDFSDSTENQRKQK